MKFQRIVPLLLFFFPHCISTSHSAYFSQIMENLSKEMREYEEKLHTIIKDIPQNYVLQQMAVSDYERLQDLLQHTIVLSPAFSHLPLSYETISEKLKEKIINALSPYYSKEEIASINFYKAELPARTTPDIPFFSSFITLPGAILFDETKCMSMCPKALTIMCYYSVAQTLDEAPFKILSLHKLILPDNPFFYLLKLYQYTLIQRYLIKTAYTLSCAFPLKILLSLFLKSQNTQEKSDKELLECIAFYQNNIIPSLDPFIENQLLKSPTPLYAKKTIESLPYQATLITEKLKKYACTAHDWYIYLITQGQLQLLLDLQIITGPQLLAERNTEMLKVKKLFLHFLQPTHYIEIKNETVEHGLYDWQNTEITPEKYLRTLLERFNNLKLFFLNPYAPNALDNMKAWYEWLISYGKIKAARHIELINSYKKDELVHLKEQFLKIAEQKLMINYRTMELENILKERS